MIGDDFQCRVKKRSLNGTLLLSSAAHGRGEQRWRQTLPRDAERRVRGDGYKMRHCTPMRS